MIFSYMYPAANYCIKLLILLWKEISGIYRLSYATTEREKQENYVSVPVAYGNGSD